MGLELLLLKDIADDVKLLLVLLDWSLVWVVLNLLDLNMSLRSDAVCHLFT